MPVCKNPSLTFLNQFGYNVIKLPRTGIEPMHVVGRDETTQLLGPLSSVWKSTLPVPTPNPPRNAADVNGQKTDKIDLKFSLKILENALKAFGASVPSLGFALNKARNISFEFTNVTSTTVEPFDAGNYLAAGDLNTMNPVVQHYFSDDAEAFLIVDVLKSDSVKMTPSDEHGADISLDVPAIQAAVGRTSRSAPSGASNATLIFKGAVPVTFGFAALGDRPGEQRLEGAGREAVRSAGLRDRRRRSRGRFAAQSRAAPVRRDDAALVSCLRSSLAFGRRCIPAGCVAHRSNIPDMLPLRALPSGRLAASVHNGLLRRDTESRPMSDYADVLIDIHEARQPIDGPAGRSHLRRSFRSRDRASAAAPFSWTSTRSTSRGRTNTARRWATAWPPRRFRRRWSKRVRCRLPAPGCVCKSTTVSKRSRPCDGSCCGCPRRRPTLRPARTRRRSRATCRWRNRIGRRPPIRCSPCSSASPIRPASPRS